MKNLLVIVCSSFVLFTACNNASPVQSNSDSNKTIFPDSLFMAEWVLPVNGNENMEEGFSLKDSAAASSINMATLLYHGWKNENGQLLLKGTSVGNHTSSEFTDSFKINFVNDSVLSLQKNNVVFNYHKRKPDYQGCYFYAMGRDTVWLSINLTGEDVSGKLEYSMYEKDSPLGFIKGKIKNNLLDVLYTFYSEGEKSESEELFKIENNSLMQARGERKVVGNRSVFVHKNAITFDSKFTNRDCNTMNWSYRWKYVKP